MKPLLTLLLALCLAVPAAFADDTFNVAALQQDDDLYAFTHPGTLDTVYRMLNQPYFGQAEFPEYGSLAAYVDYVTLVDLDATLLRLMVSIEVFDPIGADEMRLTVGGKAYTFAVTYDQSEYDGLYMEDYAVCLTDASLPLLKAIAQQKQDAPIPVELLYQGEAVFTGLVIIPGEDAADLYDHFVDLGGLRQQLKQLDESWPCKVEKAP